MNAATEDAFPYGADVRVLDPAAGKGAEAAQQEAFEAAQVISCLYTAAAVLNAEFEFHYKREKMQARLSRSSDPVDLLLEDQALKEYNQGLVCCGESRVSRRVY